MKVALVVYRDDYISGGSLRVAETLASCLPHAGVEATLVFAYGSRGAVGNNSKIHSHYLGAPHARHPSSWRRARAYFRDRQFDILHFVDPALWIQACTVGLKSAAILHHHGRQSPYSERPKPSLLDRIVLHRHKLHIAISHGAREWNGRYGFSPAPCTQVLHNAVDPSFLAGIGIDAQAARARLALPGSGRLLGMACRLTRPKGVEDLVRLLGRLPSEFEVALAGSGPMRGTICDLAARMGVAHRLHMLGTVTDMHTFYAALDGYVFLSRYEPFGLVMAEAMSMNVPVFGLRGAGEYDEHEKPLINRNNSVFVARADTKTEMSHEPDQTIERLAEEVCRLFNDKERHARLCECAREWILTHFNPLEQAQHAAEIYRQALP